MFYLLTVTPFLYIFALVLLCPPANQTSDEDEERRCEVCQ